MSDGSLFIWCTYKINHYFYQVVFSPVPRDYKVLNIPWMSWSQFQGLIAEGRCAVRLTKLIRRPRSLLACLGLAVLQIGPLTTNIASIIQPTLPATISLLFAVSSLRGLYHGEFYCYFYCVMCLDIFHALWYAIYLTIPFFSCEIDIEYFLNRIGCTLLCCLPIK